MADSPMANDLLPGVAGQAAVDADRVGFALVPPRRAVVAVA